jgi:tol-pal system protein YbgF
MRRQLIAAALSLLFSLSGCAGGMVAGGGEMRRELDALRAEVADLKDRSRAVGGGSPPADMRLELDNIRSNLQNLTENIETASIGGGSLRQQLEYMSAQLDRLEKQANLKPLSRDVVAPAVPLAIPAPVQPEPLPAQSPPPAEAYPAGPGAAPAGPPPGDIQPGPPVIGGQPQAPAQPSPVSSAYDAGKLLFDQKRYSEAIESLRAYMVNEPGGAQVAAAQFYIGESLYFQNKFEDAILEYQNVVSGFPKSPLVSTALLKQGLSFQALNDKASAKLLYQKVVRDFPKSYSAGIARERLKTI